MYLLMLPTYVQALSVLMKICRIKNSISMYLDVITLHLTNVQVVTKIDSALMWIGNLFGMFTFHD